MVSIASTRHPRLTWLDELGRSLSTHDDVLAVLGLGSAGVETDRFDDHSDLDFFVVVESPSAKRRLLAGTDWIEQTATLSFSFVNDRNGRKALLADGTLLEYAVFTPDELADLAFTGARVVWLRPGAPNDLADRGRPVPQPGLPTTEFHLHEALTNLLVGLHREARGERLTAFRFIQVFAVDRVLSLLRLSQPPDHPHLDPFELTRRAEQFYDAESLPLRDMTPGYDHNLAAARCTYDWLVQRWPVDPHLRSAVEGAFALATKGEEASRRAEG